MNKHILDPAVQEFIHLHLNDDVHKIAMAKSPFTAIESNELSNQIAAKKKCLRKLPTWYHQQGIYYPSLLSIEQSSSEITAQYKARLAIGTNLIDLTGGFGVDCFYFAKNIATVTHCEINAELSEIAAHNAKILGQANLRFLAGDGLEFLRNTSETFDTIYIDPARRSSSGKVFLLRDCTPNIVEHLNLLLQRSHRLIIKTAPFLDIAAGLKELSHVAEVHIVSVKNECKELLWVVEREATKKLKIVCTTLNEKEKQFTFFKDEEETAGGIFTSGSLSTFLYEPDAALLKSGAFNLIAKTYGLEKLDSQTQLYTAETLNEEFPGRIFRINRVISSGELKKEKQLIGNVIVRNYRDKAENLVKKYKIKPDQHQFLIFTQSKSAGYIVIDATVEQYY